MRLDPSPELYGLTLDAAVRWQAATGCTIEVGAGGVPLLFREDTGCGRTIGTGRTREWHQASAVEFRVDRSRCTSLEHTVPHEVGHVLCLSGPEYAEDGCHTGAGLMRGDKQDAALFIDAESLGAVCASAGCPLFVPEQ